MEFWHWDHFRDLQRQLPIPTNLSAYFASLVPYRFSPYVTTYISLAAIILVSVVFSVALSRREISPWLVFIFVVTLSLLPGGFEIYLNVTDLQWVVAHFLQSLQCPKSISTHGWLILGRSPAV